MPATCGVNGGQCFRTGPRRERQLDRIGQQPSDEEIWRSVELARHEDRPYTLDYV